ncbi:hypothetical protein JCM10213_003416, partial [Rhodosporidiobolus nylandii]
MPVPPLPNELVTLIFEHLYRLLCVHPGEEYLILPMRPAFVFSPFCLVSKTWYHLSQPFLFRHLSAEQLHRADRFLEAKQARDLVLSVDFTDLAPPFNGAADRYPHFRMDVLSRSEDLKTEYWRSLVQRYAGTLQHLEFSTRPESAVRFRGEMWDTEGAVQSLCAMQNFPALRSLRLDLSSAGLPTFLFDILWSAPSLTDLFLTAKGEPELDDDALLPPKSDFPPLRLETLDMEGVSFDLDTLDDILMPFLRSVATSLKHLRLHLAVEVDIDEPFVIANALSLTFPRLLTLELVDPMLFCASPNLLSISPCIREAHLTFSTPATSSDLPFLPSTLRHLAFTSYREDLVPVLTQHLESSVESDALPELRSAGIRILSDVDDEAYEGELLDAEVRRVIGAFAALCARYGVNFHSDTLPVEFWEGPEPMKAVEVAGRVYRCIADVPPEKLDDDYAPPNSSGSNEEDAASESEWELEEDVPDEAWNWDAEDDPLFEARWSREKREAGLL